MNTTIPRTDAAFEYYHEGNGNLSHLRKAMEELERENAKLTTAKLELLTSLDVAFRLLGKAFARIHTLPRSSDTELAESIDVAIGAMRRAIAKWKEAE